MTDDGLTAIVGIAQLENGGWLVAAFSIVVVIVAGVIGAVILDRRDLEFSVSAKPLGVGMRKRRPGSDQAKNLRYAGAILRLGDLEQALTALPGADEATLGRWFTHLCENLGWLLALGTTTHYRVAIWSDDDSDTTILRRVALHGFDRNDARMQSLERATTVAGWVVANRRDHYVKDITNDLIYRPRRSDPAYRSMFAAPLGDDQPWGAITIDADVVDGIQPDQQELVHRFGKLATTGASLAAGPGPAAATGETSNRPNAS